MKDVPNMGAPSHGSPIADALFGKTRLGVLQRIYFQYNLKDIVSRVQATAEEEMPRIVWSEALV